MEKGYVSVADALELIKAHTKEEPTVDLQFLVVNREYLDVSHNFTIRLAEKRNGKLYTDDVVYVRVKGNADKYNLMEAIEEAYARNYDLQLDAERPIYASNSIVDPETNPKGRPIADDLSDPLYKADRNTRIS